MRGFLTGKNAP